MLRKVFYVRGAPTPPPRCGRVFLVFNALGVGFVGILSKKKERKKRRRMEEFRRNQSRERDESRSRRESVHGDASGFMVVMICFVHTRNALNTTLIGTVGRGSLGDYRIGKM